MTRFTVILSVGLLLFVGQLQATTVMGDQPATMSPSPSCSTPTPATSTSNSAEDCCLRRCTDFTSGVCKGKRNMPIRFTVNGTTVSTETDLNVELSQRGYDTVGNWILYLIAYNVCEPVNIRCLEGEWERLSYNIRFCEDELDSRNLTTNSTSELQPPGDKSYIAAVVLVPTFFFVVAIAVVVAPLIWCWKRRKSHPPPAPPAPSGGDHHEDDVPVDQQPQVVVPIGEGDDNNTQTPPTDPEPVSSKDTSNSVMYRASFREQPGSRVSREDMKMVERVGDSVPTCIRPHTLDSSKNIGTLVEHGLTSAGYKPHIVDDPLDSSRNITLVEQCSDKHGLTPAAAWSYGCKTSVTDVPLRGTTTYWIPPQSVPGEEVVAV